MSITVLLVGCGNMGHALLEGWLHLDQPPVVHVVEPTEALRERAAANGTNAVGSVRELPADFQPDVIVLAVKPQIMASALSDYVRFSGSNTTFVSIAAGIPMALIEAALPSSTPVVRCMPNTPAAIGQGVMAICTNRFVGERQILLASRLLAAGGMVVTVSDESQMDMVTAVSGSGPAYLFHFIEALTSAAIKIGLPENVASSIALQTIQGASQLALQSGEPAAELRMKVTSPGGTTAAALDVFMADEAMTRLVTDAVEAAWRRAVELGTSN